jgi:hypothetical protein
MFSYRHKDFSIIRRCINKRTTPHWQNGWWLIAVSLLNLTATSPMLPVGSNVLTDFTNMKIISGLLFILLIGCTDSKSKSDTQTLDLGSFSIETPNGWTKITDQGIDSYVGRITIDRKDTLHFDLGWYSNRLNEYDPTILDSSMIGSIDTAMIDTSKVIFVKNRMLADPDKYKRNNVSWDTIDGHKAKIVFPRQTGIGITGIYIDSLWQSGSGVDRFNLYGNNLEPVNEKLLLQALKTLKFHRTK